MNLCELSSGKVCIMGCDLSLEEMETLEAAEIAPDFHGLNSIIMNNTAEYTFSFKSRIGLRGILTLTGLKEEIYNLCFNNRVIHLAEKARKHKTRKKNLRRAIRIVERNRKNEM